MLNAQARAPVTHRKIFDGDLLSSFSMSHVVGPFSLGLAFPKKDRPSRRLDRDGEGVITKVVAGTCNHLKLLFRR
jgi:hypothetical protein